MKAAIVIAERKARLSKIKNLAYRRNNENGVINRNGVASLSKISENQLNGRW
jgi:hypothetical protein